MGLTDLIHKIPGGPRVQVLVIALSSIALCAIPVYCKDEKAGHDLFSQEKPEAVQASQERLQKEFRKRNQQ